MRHSTGLDIIIVGGGLAGSLTAWRLRQANPRLRVKLIEQGPALGGNHTWSFFDSDLEPNEISWLGPLVSFRWDSYDVFFPGRRRTLATGYRSISSEQLHTGVSAALGAAVETGQTVVEVAPSSVLTSMGETFEAPCVIDARGHRQTRHLALGFQKFLGREVRLARPHDLTRPTIMDATVAQADGYRFVYTLPLAADRLLIEDTYYSDDEGLPLDALRARIAAYAEGRGWSIAEVVREENGVLPIVLAGDLEGLVAECCGAVPRIGLAAALFHPTTGYSLPDAVRLADRLAHACPASSAAAATVIAGYMRSTWRERSIFRLLNRMLFRAGAPQHRYRVLERFYGLDESLIRRFYAGRPTFADCARLLAGKPPVPILSALSCVSEKRMLHAQQGS